MPTHGPPPPAPRLLASLRVEMADEYEASTRTIKRDIEYLRDVMGAPIQYDPASRGYYLSEPTWSIASIQLSQSELLSLTIAADVLEAYRNSPLYEDLLLIFEKITSQLPETVSVSPACRPFLVHGRRVHHERGEELRALSLHWPPRGVVPDWSRH